eukprot:TRINITY_DN4299_c0_g1_i2.p1 TRINITY_DN4299_c0_g1~~TRINITY_DN4299_c0_g1_i2.p1  ORF type:complete len:1136 (-),score=256.23 TRINITY_DN4299_c0_g1_i2:4242-7649(-)
MSYSQIEIIDDDDQTAPNRSAALPAPSKSPAKAASNVASSSPLKSPKQTSMTSFFTKKPSGDSTSSPAKSDPGAVFRPPQAQKPPQSPTATTPSVPKPTTPTFSPPKSLSAFSSTSSSTSTPTKASPLSDQKSKSVQTPPKSASKSPKDTKSTIYNSDSDSGDDASAAGAGSDSEELDWRQKKRKIDQEQWKERNKAKYQFLDEIQDENRRKPGDPDYDTRTLFIPSSALVKMTNFEQQYWDIKRKNFDTVVFFNKGMFYEIFETDAEICQRVLGLTMTDRAGMRMVGLPKSSYESFAAKLIAQGYKVARVEQVETPIGRDKQQRNVKSVDDFKETVVLKRVLDRIISPGTVVEEAFIADHNPVYLLSIVEKHQERSYGICLVDTSRSEFLLGRLDDDLQRTLLKTLLLQTKPKEYIFIRSELSKETQHVLTHTLAVPPPHTPLRREAWWDAPTMIDKLKYGDYLSPKSKIEDWPAALKFYAEDDLVMSALGGCAAYLHSAQLDQGLISMRNFQIYDAQAVMRDDSKIDHLILDGKALSNLEILENEVTRTKEGSLLELVDQCSSPFGRRMMKHWICRPLRRVEAINDRLDAVTFLIQHPNLAHDLENRLRKFPDLERLASRCHSQFMNLQEFLKLLDGFEMVRVLAYETIPALLAEHVSGGAEGVESTMLQNLLSVDIMGTNPSAIPDFDYVLKSMFEAFDVQTARDSGKIQPVAGVDPNYDNFKSKVDKIKEELDVHLEEHRRYFKTGKVNYVTVGKDNYVVEVPKDAATRYPPPTKGWTEKKGTQKVARYWTEFITQRMRPLAEALEDLALAENHILRRLLMRFDENKDLWHRIVLKLAEIDCLLSLARVSSSEGMVKPEVVSAAEPILEIRGGKHPCLANKMGSSFVPNDIALSVFDGRAVLLTGPNMGGKSTLLRQVCIGVVMAQIGCYVMAESMKLSPVDRIFTRIGASDNIFEGQSTFLVELLETASVCNFASKNSLVILDELGRGTSTHDGYAIAFAVLDHLLKRVRCRTLFSTHYHKLTDEWKGQEIGRDLQVCHMAALVNGISTTELIQKEAAQEQGDADRMDVDSEAQHNQDVMFLYQMRSGGCPRSYGLNVAQMADLPPSLIQEASRKSEEFFKQMQKSRMCA